MDPEKVKELIENGMSAVHVEVEGDGSHFEAVIVSNAFDGKQKWVNYDNLGTFGDDFNKIGPAFDVAHELKIQHINQAEVRFFKQRAVVDFAVEWMEANRDFTK